MIEFEDSDDDEAPGGLPAWLATFADLMSLLMCFFVLLLSFSEMDVQKYKQVAGSMKDAFGVQNEVNVKDIPKGTSIIAREFSPARPDDPTVENVVRQKTVDSNRNTLDIRSKEEGESEKGKGQGEVDEGDKGKGKGEGEGGEQDAQTEEELKADEARKALIEQLKKLIQQTEADAKRIAEALDEEIKAGKVEVNSAGRNITIRILEQGSFPSGSADINPAFVPVLDKIRFLLKDVGGKIAVEGHTDNIPIATRQFRSNWDLSTARALAVNHELQKNRVVDHKRFRVTGYGDTKPVAKNDSQGNRAQNRRVELIIRQGLNSNVTESLKTLNQGASSLFQSLQVDDGISQEDISALEDLL
ncbi:flagellar motor protein MotB [Porticoccus sp. W117]|uniref:flagellar motor protein MotB n=1 Tax=Porticoccus sp. W117 TaxID=3054777 RepID=UPI0025955867|nr:flagellar motor protein MotB [Porticoccus sp. W117]MDM3871979.1 flagellar motor protein MotB [Porticoccus sp. W117]